MDPWEEEERRARRAAIKSWIAIGFSMVALLLNIAIIVFT